MIRTHTKIKRGKHVVEFERILNEHGPMELSQIARIHTQPESYLQNSIIDKMLDTEELYHIEGKGWWFTGQPIPNKGVSPERVAEIAAMPDEAIDLSDIPEQVEAIAKSKLRLPDRPPKPVTRTKAETQAEAIGRQSTGFDRMERNPLLEHLILWSLEQGYFRATEAVQFYLNNYQAKYVAFPRDQQFPKFEDD